MRSQIGIDPFISIIRSSVDGTISFNILIVRPVGAMILIDSCT